MQQNRFPKGWETSIQIPDEKYRSCVCQMCFQVMNS